MNNTVAYRDLPASGRGTETHVPKVLVVDPCVEAYQDWAAAAGRGEVQIHFRSSGQAARALMRRVWFDVCIVGDDLEDMAGEDFRELLRIAAVRPCLAAIPSAAARGTVKETLAGLEAAAAIAGRGNRGAGVANFPRVAGSFLASAAAAAAAMGLMLSK